MKFSCTQENLALGLYLVSKIASRAGNLPILSNIHLKTGESFIELKSTNLEMGITSRVRAKIEQEGEFTVPAKLFTDYVTFLPKEKVDIVLEGGEILVVSGKNKTKIKGLPAADFPLIPPIEEGARWQVALPTFLEALEQVLFTISATETRPEISGALFIFGTGKLTVAGTDSYRLAEKAVRAEGPDKKEPRLIVPLRALQELSRICGAAKEETGTAALIASPNQLAVTVGNTEFISRLIDGQYPDYQAIVPNKFGVKAKVSRAEFASAVKAAGLFSKAGVYDVSVALDPGAGEMEIAALNSQTGEHKSAIAAEVQGGPVKIAFNWKYLLEGLNALRGESIWFKATDAAAPTMLTENDGGDYFYILMPIKE